MVKKLSKISVLLIQSYNTDSRQGEQFYKGDPVHNKLVSKDCFLEQKMNEHSSSSFFDKMISGL